MGTLLFRSISSLRFVILAALFVLSISVHVLASDDPQSDDGDGEDTAFARSSVVRIQI